MKGSSFCYRIAKHKSKKEQVTDLNYLKQGGGIFFVMNVKTRVTANGPDADREMEMLNTV